MSANAKKSIGVKVMAWILIGAMILTFVCAIIVVLVQQYNLSNMSLIY